MSKIRKILRLFVPEKILQQRRLKIELRNCEKYKIIKSPTDTFDSLLHIKDKTWETMYAPAVYGRAKERIIHCTHPSQDILLIKNAIITQDSDLVLTEHGAWWDKYNDEDFMSRAKPWDNNVVRYDSKVIYIHRRKYTKHISGRVLSLVGVFSQVWSHFIFQYLGKLYYAGEAGLLDNDIVLLTYDYKDSNIEELINSYIKKFPKVKRLRVAFDSEYLCDELIAIPSLSTNYNETRFDLDYGFCIPNNVIDILNKYVVSPYIEKVKNNPVIHPKVFIGRSSNRILSNKEEIEAYFRKEGFYFIEGANLTLEEKANLFYHAEEIVGMHCSAWQNLIFCKSAKCLMFVNNRYSTETIFRTMAYEKTPYWMNLAGQDESYDLRSNYYISLKKVKSAYMALKASRYE